MWYIKRNRGCSIIVHLIVTAGATLQNDKYVMLVLKGQETRYIRYL